MACDTLALTPGMQLASDGACSHSIKARYYWRLEGEKGGGNQQEAWKLNAVPGNRSYNLPTEQNGGKVRLRANFGEGRY